MQREVYSVKCPKQIVFGDPMYFERFKGKRLSDLVVNFSPPDKFDAKLVLEENEVPELPDYMERTMTLFMAPKEII